MSCGCKQQYQQGGKRKTRKGKKLKGKRKTQKGKKSKGQKKYNRKSSLKTKKTNNTSSLKSLLSSKRKIYKNGELKHDEELYLTQQNDRRDFFYRKNNEPPIIFTEKKEEMEPLIFASKTIRQRNNFSFKK